MGKIVLLIRHAKAHSLEKYSNDFSRELKSKGVDQSIISAKRILSRKIEVDKVLSSPALRAKQTAELIAEKLRAGKQKFTIEYDLSIYEANADRLFKLVKSQPTSINCFILIGHNPGLSDLANLIVPTFTKSLSKCSVLAVEYSGKSWKTMKQENCKELFYMEPFE